jgi:large subunit ribosomal protein L7Ae
VYKALFQPNPRIVGIGQARKQKLNLTRFVKWPKYVRLQRQRRVLLNRLKVPPAIAQFSRTASKPLAAKILKFLNKYRPEEEKHREQRLKSAAAEKVKGNTKPVDTGKKVIAYGLNEVVNLIERKKAEFVVIAHDVDPIELVLYLPALCNKMNVPYAIVKSKARLGSVVHQNTTAALAITDVNKADREEFAKLIESVRGSFNDRYAEENRKWGGLKLSKRSTIEQSKKQTVA